MQDLMEICTLIVPNFIPFLNCLISDLKLLRKKAGIIWRGIHLDKGCEEIRVRVQVKVDNVFYSDKLNIMITVL